MPLLLKLGVSRLLMVPEEDPRVGVGLTDTGDELFCTWLSGEVPTGVARMDAGD
jgi:hypothetical protein